MASSLQRILAFIGGIILLPFIGAAVIAIRLEGAGPSLYRARRVGTGGREFVCLKLRTMRPIGVDRGNAITASGDRRVTQIGAILRRYRLDELPQLWNVARGEMLLVGPRPEDPRFVDLADPLHRLVFTATPGITGLTQLAFADEADMLDAADPERQYREVILPRKLAMDADYLRRRSARLDLWILGQTLLTALGRRTPLAAIEARR